MTRLLLATDPNAGVRQPPVRIAMPKLRDDQLAPALVFVAFAAWAAVVRPQPDTFFHLSAGREIWRTGSLVTTERFSHTAAGTPWHNHEWLSQVFMYGVYELGGAVLLTLVAGACVFASLLWSWKLMRGAYEVRLLLLFSLALLTPLAWAVRPQAFSMLIFMLALYLVLRDRLAWMPVLIALWANAHGVVVLGVVLAGAHACDALLWSRTRRLRAVALAVACVAAPMLSPLGWHYWPRILETVSEARLIGIREYTSALQWGTWGFWLLLLALLGSVALRRRALSSHDRQDRLLVLTALVLGIAGILAVRNAPFFAVVAAPAVSRMLDGRFRPVRSADARGAGVALIVLAVAAVAALVVYEWRDRGSHLGWRPVSEGAVMAIGACPGPIFNTYKDGGPLTWFVPGQPVFVDGRIEAYPPRVLRASRQADIYAEYEATFLEYGINCAVVPTSIPMYDKLLRDPSMTVVHRDASRAVFVRTGLL